MTKFRTPLLFATPSNNKRRANTTTPTRKKPKTVQIQLQPTKQPQSHTKTKTKTKKKRVYDEPHSSVGDESFNVVVHPTKPKGVDKGFWKMSQSHRTYVLYSAGKQSVDTICAFANLSQIRTSTGPTYTGLQAQVAIEQLNPNLASTGSSILDAVTRPLTDKFFLKSINSTLTFTNFSSAAQVVDLYWVLCKKSTERSFQQLWDDGLINLSGGEVQQTIQTSPLFQGVAGYATSNEPFEKPFISKPWRDVFKVLKQQTFNMAGGASQMVYANFVMNKIINSETTSRLITDGGVNYPGCTIILNAVVRGQVVMDTLADTVTLAAPDMGYIIKNTYTCHSMHGNAGRLNIDNHSWNVPTNGPAASNTMIDSEDLLSAVKQVVI